MTFPEVLDYQRTRSRKPAVWIVFLVLWIPECVIRWTAEGLVYPTSLHRVVYAMGVPLLLMGSFVWAAPWPWLWTGRCAEFPRLGRGMAQSWIFGLLLLLGISSLEWVIQPHEASSKGYFQSLGWAVFIGQPMIFGVIGFAVVAFDKAMLAKSQAEQKAQEAQWILLQGQMNPHVFFNAMNNLTELIRKDPVKAEQAAMDLSDLFRRLMEHGQRPLAPLSEERELVVRYLGIESLRLGSRLNVAWEWSPALDAVHAPPFLIQPLVENALKHGLSPHPEGGELRIEGLLEGQVACIRVSNTGQLLERREAGGKGLSNLEARLRLVFELEGTFTLVQAQGWTVAELRFPVLQDAV